MAQTPHRLTPPIDERPAGDPVSTGYRRTTPPRHLCHLDQTGRNMPHRLDQPGRNTPHHLDQPGRTTPHHLDKTGREQSFVHDQPPAITASEPAVPGGPVLGSGRSIAFLQPPARKTQEVH